MSLFRYIPSYLLFLDLFHSVKINNNNSSGTLFRAFLASGVAAIIFLDLWRLFIKLSTEDSYELITPDPYL